MGIRFIRLGIVFLLLGIVLGVVMHHLQSGIWIPLHAHVSLVGGFLSFIFGLIYQQFPRAARSRFAQWHYWLFLLSESGGFLHMTVEAMNGRTFNDASQHVAELRLVLIALGFAASLLLFAINMFKNLTDVPLEKSLS